MLVYIKILNWERKDIRNQLNNAKTKCRQGILVQHFSAEVGCIGPKDTR